MGISKKLIFFSFIFINFIQPSKSAELSNINKNIDNSNIKVTLSNLFNLEIPSDSHNNSIDSNTNYIKFFKKKIDSLLVAKPTNNKS